MLQNALMWKVEREGGREGAREGAREGGESGALDLTFIYISTHTNNQVNREFEIAAETLEGYRYVLPPSLPPSLIPSINR